MDAICDDAAAEHAVLDGLVGTLAADDWDRATPAEGWSIRDQISHLWFFDQRASMAMADPPRFEADKAVLLGAGRVTDASVDIGRSMSSEALLAAWRDDRRRMLEVARTIDPSVRVPWYGPAMGARSFITARLMETWAHGQDVADALGVTRAPTPRLKHVAHIGVRARPFSYAIRNMTLPDVDVHVRLAGPAGDEWTWNDPASADVVSGSALGFCLVVTQRRHVSDTDLVVTGEAANEWIGIAQAFAGAPTSGRPPIDRSS
ncbi:MAG: TIGR03084 family metal-binding protein [Ilumatobacteraceae bacterium]